MTSELRHRRGLRLAAALLALALAACGERAPPAGAAVDLSRVKLVLGDQARLLRSKVEAAHAFDGVPYQVEWANFQGAAPLFEALTSGDVDTAIAADTPTLAAAAAKAPFKAIAAVRAGGRGVGLLVQADSPIRSVADLKGRKVIVSSARGSIAHYLLLGALREAGLDIGDVDVSFMLPSEAAAAFNSHWIEVWATFGTYQAVAEKNGARLIRDGTGIYSGIALIAASDKALADPGKRAALADVLQRLAATDAWVAAHPAEYTAVFAQLTGLPLDISGTVVDWQRARVVPIDAGIIASLQQVANTFSGAGLLPGAIDVPKIVDASLYRAPP